VDDEFVRVDRVPEASSEPLEIALDPLVLERGHASAAVADRVVVVLTSGQDRLVPGAAVAEVDTLDESHLVQEVERAIDAGEADGRPGSAKPLGDLLRRQAAALLGEQLDDCAAGAAGAVPGLGERASR
jgi:hypothetical protein